MARSIPTNKWEPLHDWSRLRNDETIVLLNPATNASAIGTVDEWSTLGGNDWVRVNGTEYRLGDGWTIQYDALNTKLPKTGIVMWADYDRNRHVAFQDGHPANDAWVADGTRMSGDDLIAIIGRHTTVALDYVD